MAKIERTKNATRNVIFGIILKTYQIIVPFLMRTAMIYLMGVEYLGTKFSRIRCWISNGL